jgi:hypothetical protein
LVDAAVGDNRAAIRQSGLANKLPQLMITDANQGAGNGLDQSECCLFEIEMVAEWYRGPGTASALEAFMRFKMAQPDVSTIYSFNSEKAI